MPAGVRGTCPFFALGRVGHAHSLRRGVDRLGICPVAGLRAEHVQWPGWAAWDMLIFCDGKRRDIHFGHTAWDMLILRDGAGGHAHSSRRGVGRLGICPVAGAGTGHVQSPGWAAWDMLILSHGIAGTCPFFAAGDGHLRNMSNRQRERGTCPGAASVGVGHVQWWARAGSMSSGGRGFHGGRAGPDRQGPDRRTGCWPGAAQQRTA